MIRQMRQSEIAARAYCREIGAAPDELVWGYNGDREWIQRARWWWYQTIRFGRASRD